MPILRKLFRELTDTVQLDAWENLTEVMNWAGETLNRVDRPAFFAKFQDAEAVQYFYEPFLEAFDPDLRKQLGVWYTPPEIVKYMVARVDQVLKSDFNRPDGLADTGVYVLDPCCGTGAYLVEVLNTIAATLTEKGEEGLLAGRLKQAATERVFGFEILPAPFVVAHLQLGLFLQQHGTALDEKRHERASVYLTNALTGWKPPTGPKQKLLFPEMEEERDKADRVKQEFPILVVLGNPPYNGFAGLPAEEEAGLVEPYRTTKTAPKPQGQGLNDLYVRFFRVAERRITERHVQHGIVCYISNYSWLDGRSHTGMRERFYDEFDQIWIDYLHGNRTVSEYAPDGQTSETVFAMCGSSPGIKVGTAITLLARTENHATPAKIYYRDWDQAKADERRNVLLRSIDEVHREGKCKTLDPDPFYSLTFRPLTAAASYSDWPLLVEIFPISFPGANTAKDDLLVGIQREHVSRLLDDYFDSSISFEDLAITYPRIAKDSATYNGKKIRASLLKVGRSTAKLIRFAYRPFDFRWLFWEGQTKLLDRGRPDYQTHLFPTNPWLSAVPQNRKQFDPPSVSTSMACYHLVERGALMFPMMLATPNSPDNMFTQGIENSLKLGDHYTNLSLDGFSYLSLFKGVADHPHLFNHAIAIMHAPDYAQENGDALRQDWPRVPLPALRSDLLTSADLGRLVTALLDPETPVDGITAGKVRPELRVIGSATRVGGGQLSGADFAVNARWGISGKGGITMPGKGRLTERSFTPEEADALGEAGVALLGPDTLDVFLNDTAFWRNVPRKVWEYTLGGYQVLKKWLSYREQALLGRPLTVDEVGYITQVVRRITALVLLGPELDANYRRVKAATYSWPR